MKKIPNINELDVSTNSKTSNLPLALTFKWKFHMSSNAPNAANAPAIRAKGTIIVTKETI
jgi:hypothetical protein